MNTLKIIKIGGQVIDDKNALKSFLEDFSKLKEPKILVHGGGHQASKFSQRLGISVEKIDGRRVTNAETLDVILMIYAGLVNKKIVAQLQAYNANAFGFTGADGNTIISIKRKPTPIDFGYVGDVIQVNTSIINLLLKDDIIPVFCAITHDEKGQLLNTNADTLAAELAIAFSKTRKTELNICFEKNGVLSNINNENSIIENLDYSTYQDLLQNKKVVEGMIPKLDNCFRAINHGVCDVKIGNPNMIKDTSYPYTKILK
ncbi:acetylglutamate kinase [Flavobacteriaceae bacterium 14752]|uniref:acetylglutamate kinase n=1 Tax=Mesohalobacter salilacus TaxID=2491711 RepID=UPI000F64081D|nr:acetylglutamate kinase [Flavobacteriaceae bacterium 14752]